MKALDVMVRNVITVKPDDQVAEAVKLLAEHDISALPVVDDGNNVVGSSAKPTCCAARRSARKNTGRGGWKR